ncbi:hypothetical protein [Micromonospora sp. RP3T]|uniref:hypothetical protein n=1 Tax=Micromonospora sp. RP3T TaxID=2135446 RepID=UPI001E36FD0A|nr:hypothetical protein [Micromonospora sp. RP3T]
MDNPAALWTTGDGRHGSGRPRGGDGHVGSARDQEELEAAGALLADEPEPEPEPEPDEPDPDEPEPDPEDEPEPEDEPDEEDSDEDESDFPGLLAGLDALSEPDERESVR